MRDVVRIWVVLDAIDRAAAAGRWFVGAFLWVAIVALMLSPLACAYLLGRMGR